MSGEGDYKVELEDFAGPLDLLLHLVRNDEIQIEALPIARITEQYLRFIDALPKVDLDRAGDFLVMAAQLLTWKARALLPAARPEGDPLAAGEDARARAELVKDLLEYRALKERARLLEDRADESARRFGRESPRTIEEVPALKNVDLWDLVTAFQRLEKEIGALHAHKVLAEDDAPLSVFVDRVRERLARGGGAIPFREMFGERPTRGEMVAVFLALLELIRLGEARARQAATFGDIEIVPGSGGGSGTGTGTGTGT